MVDVSPMHESETFSVDHDICKAWVDGILFPDHPDMPGAKLALGYDSDGKPGMYEHSEGIWIRHHECTAGEIEQLGFLEGVVAIETRSKPGPRVVVRWNRIHRPKGIDEAQSLHSTWEADLPR